MPHAVIRIYSEDRPYLDRNGMIRIRRKFRGTAEQCRHHQVVLYQSRRDGLDKGYFARAFVEEIYDDPANAQRCLIRISKFELLDSPGPMIVNGVPQESALRSSSNQLKGWKAAEDVRLITDTEFSRLTGLSETSDRHGTQHIDLVSMPSFRVRHVRNRDPRFTHLIYRAYGGRCAISGVALLSPARRCSLEAAHVFPYRLKQLDLVTAGILLAPNWHSRFDDGLIIIEDDYSWRAVVEDADTQVISERRLRLPDEQHHWPDLDLLRQKRELLGH